MLNLFKFSEHYTITSKEYNEFLASHIYLQRLIQEGKCDSVLNNMVTRVDFFGDEILKAVKERIEEISNNGDLPY